VDQGDGARLATNEILKMLGRLRKKGLSAACSLTLVSPRGREVKESSHLLSRVRNFCNFTGPPESFFRTLLGAVRRFGTRVAQSYLVVRLKSGAMAKGVSND